MKLRINRMKEYLRSLNDFFKFGIIIWATFLFFENSIAQEKHGQWIQEEISAFMFSCSNNSQEQGLNNFTSNVYCSCTLQETIKLFPDGAPQLEQWEEHQIRRIVDGCLAIAHSKEAVNDSEPVYESLVSVVSNLIDKHEYERSLSLLGNVNIKALDINPLLEKTYLNYGLYFMSRFIADENEMSVRMNKALIQFTEVLKINSNNVLAREQIQQIIMIYDTRPGYEPHPEVLKGLRDIGVEY